MNALAGSSTPDCNPAGTIDDNGMHSSDSALPRATITGGIPRIDIMNENAVYDHYLRRLNRVWMRRIKVQGVATEYARSPPHVVPAFIFPAARSPYCSIQYCRVSDTSSIFYSGC